MSRFLRFCAFLSVLFFTTNVFAAGYSCPTYKKYTSCSAGYYMTNSSGTTYNGTPAVGNLCTICPKGYYCTGGTANKVACSAGRYGSSTGLRTSACSGVIAAGRYGSAGATSANGSGAVSAGYYSSGGGTKPEPTEPGNGCLRGNKCGKVSTGCYGSAGATTDCPNGCPAGYQAGEGTTAQSNCLASCAAGTRVATANAACTAITSGNVYMPAHMVKYGQISEEPKSCPSSYTISGTTQADHDAKDDCKITCSAGTRVTTPDATCSSISSSTGYYITSHTVSAGLTSPAATQCPENYRSGAGTTAQSNCLASCAAGSRVATENAACTAITSGNVYMLAHTVKYGQTSAAATSCPSSYTISGTTQADHDQKSDCKITCSAGTRVTTADATCSSISGSTGYYITSHTVSAGLTSPAATQCPENYRSGAGTTAQSNCLASCAAGTRVATENAACTAITSGNVYMLAHTVKYGQTSAAATSCPSSYTISGTTQADHDAKADCKITCSAGTRVTTPDATCSSISSSTGYYITSHTVSAGLTSPAATQCPENYRTGAGTTAQSNCLASCAAGSRVATANEACSAITSGNVYMLAHTVKYGETSATATSCPSSYTISGTTQADHDAKDDCKISCNAGYAVLTADATCSTIQNSTYKGKYTAAHTVSAGSTSTISTCPANYQTGNGAAGQANCTTSCAAGSRVATANEACSAITSGNVYMLAHTVKYGATSAAATSCPSSYTISGTTQADHDAKSDCKITCSAGTRVTTADATCSSISSSTGYYITSHTVSAGSTSPAATQCPENYRSGAGTTSQANCSLTTTAGKYVAAAGAGETACISPYYCPGGTTIKYGTGTTTGGNSACTDLGAIYSKSDAGASAGTNCYATTTSTKWVASAKASSESTCTAGYYCAGGTKVYYNSTGGRTACGGGKYSAEGATSCSNITAGCYGTSASSSCPAVCGANKYSDAGASACTACDSDYANSGDTAESHAGVASCKVTCAAGTYVASSGAACTDVGNGYYTTESQTISQGSTGSRSACSSLNAFYTASDSGRNATTDCFGTTTSGKFVKTAKSGEETCTAGGYCAGSVKVYYNSTGGRTACGAGTANANTGSSSSSACLTCAAGTYNTTTGNTTCSSCPAGSYCTGGSNKSACAAPYSSSAEGSDDTNDCYLTTSSTKYVAEVGKGEVTCAAGGYCPGGSTIYRGGTVTGRVTTGGRTACGAGTANANTGSSASSACTACAAGTYSTGGASSCSTVNDGCYGGASATSACPNSCSSLNSFYTKSDSGRNDNTDCYGTTTSGNWIKTQKSGQVTCDAGGYCPGSVKVYYNSTGGRTECGAGKYNASTGSSSSSACANITAGCYGTSASSSCPAVCAANKWSAAGASSCTSCPTDYENSGDTAASHANQSSCTITVDGGYYIGTAGDNSSNWDKCAGGTYKASHTVAYGGTSSCATCSAGYYCPEGASGQTPCGGNTKYSSSGAASCSTVSTGYYTTGGTSTTRTGQTKCEAGNYCSGGVKTECGGGKYSAEGATSCSNITAGCYGTSASSSCPAVCGANKYSDAGASSCTSCPTDYKNSGDTATAHAGSASCIITVSGGYYIGTAGDNSSNWDKCSAGYYKAAHSVAYGSTSSCSACGAVDKYSAAGASACSTVDTGYYTTGGTTTTRTGQLQCKSGTYCTGGVQNTCPSGYGASAAGSDAAADCYMSVAATKYVKAANDSSASACGTGTYKAAHTVYYGGTSTCSPCPSGYDDGAAVATQAECVISVAGGKYVGTANSATLSTCECGTYKAQHNVAYGSTSSCTTTSAGYYAAEGASSQTQADPGYYAAAGACEQTVLNNGCYGSAGASTACPNNCNALTAPAVTGGTFSSVTPRSTNTACRYVAPSKTDAECTSITANTVSYSGTAWGTNFYTAKANKGSYVSATGNTAAPACTTCSKGYYQASDSSTAASCTPADKGYYVDTTGASAQKQCTAGTYTSSTAQSSCSTITSGCWGAAGATSACPNNCNALTAPAVTGGTFSSVTPRSANTACRYVAPSKTDAECTSITANTVSYSGTAWGTNFYTAKANKGSYVSATGNTAAPACTTCSKGYYQASDSSTAASCTPADKGYYVDTTGASAQKQCTAGTYTSSTAQSGCSTITSGCWGAAGATSACPNNCNALTAPAVTGGTFSSVTPRNANTACRYVAPSKTDAGCSSITANTVSYSGTAWGTDFYTTKASKGYRVTATGNTSAPACTACACGTYQGTDGSTTTTCTTTSAGYYAKGTGNSSQTQADAGYYAAAGACDQTKIQAGCFGGEGSASACPNSCPAAESGWTLASTTGLKVVTDCAEITTPSTSGSPIATICTAGTLTKKATNSTTWGSATASGLTAKAGRYVNGTTCSACAAGTYTSSATTKTSCTPAAAGYYVSGTEATSQTACPAGTYGSTTGLTSSACSGKCTAGYYCPAASTSATQNECTAGNYCPAGAGAETSCATVGGKLYVNSAAKSDAATDCYISLASKVYLASATSTSTTTCTAGYYCPGGNFYYSSSATNQGRSSCTGTTYSGSGAASCTDCPSGYTANTSNNKTAASQCQISCAAGTQVATANAQCTTPSGNWYTTASQLVNYGSTSSVNACKVATNLFNPSDYDSLWGYISASRTTVAAYDANAIVWVPVEPNTTYIVSGMRGANTMTVANSASVPAIGVKISNFVDPGSVGKGMLYTTSSDAKYLILQGLRDADRATTSTRQSVLDKNVANLQIFKASDGYGIIGNATTDHDAVEDCKITCGPGQYVATEDSACVNVGAGYYAAGGAVSYGSTSTNRSQCASGLTTIGYGTGANEAADCGRKLHAGDNVIYLRSAERTSPSLRVKVGDKTFFGALSTALSGALKVKNGSTTYSVVNDWQ